MSGTLITARMATDYNRELLVVPGSIFSKTSVGVHQFLKLGATPVTTSKDILDVLGITEFEGGAAQPRPQLTLPQQAVLNLLTEPRHRDELIRSLNINTPEATQLLMLMELNNMIAVHDNIYRACI
jgi:DNA processing protein